MSTSALKDSVLSHLKYSLGKDPEHATTYDWRVALSLAARDRIVDPWFESTRATYRADAKRVYYLSMEFLIGRLLEDALVNTGVYDDAKAVFDDLGLNFGEILHDEPDAALGNGGLGRLAACFLESLSTLGIPAMGYGIRYEHGLFRQRFEGGRQVEEAEDWLTQEHVWEFERPEAAFEIGFGGQVYENGGRAVWRPQEAVIAQAFDTPVVGWKGEWANTLRLWGALPKTVLDLQRFNAGDYAAAAEPEALARTISRVLYPDDTTEEGKHLRLKQEYFFTAASLRDLIRRFEAEHDDLRDLPKRVAIQLNDTHPAIAGPELVRILHDERGMEFETAMEIARGCLNYTNHTLLPEALERWSDGLMGYLLPRHLQLIERIDTAHQTQHPGIAIREHGEVKMGELSFIMANRVNGVSALHSDLMKVTVFKDLHDMHPDRIVNQTNGVTPRRWLRTCNPRLSGLITDAIGDGWIKDAERLSELEPHVNDAGFLDRFVQAKRENKVDLGQWIAESMGISVDPDAMFDVQIKRIHEYKRQHLNILETIALWQEMRDNPNGDWTPRVKIFGGKAAPGYVFAKEIIYLINSVASVINNDPVTSKWLKVVYPANYNVTLAERLIPAANLSEQISTAGKEASGTGNMKFALNGALTIGTLDGANVEIREHVGADNFFLFGMTAEEVMERRTVEGHAWDAISKDPRLARAVDALRNGTFAGGDHDRFRGIADNISGPDYFLVASDFSDYWRASREVDQAFRDTGHWARMAALNTARSGWFSSDRTIRSYASEIWDALPSKPLRNIAAE
ncbi:glycogen/starch/alpha-glucan family phosphorylase [Alphaproteobacteria bacterium GH1-50]|uniref:Alpha-1,4 glucan phosphorylase n=1 Tax=Kangsaoukella pontilimi TaxID=2691042 RepID=A0A7C9IU42_9RHOB|nr:glycogen/starch/alpha-glucan phosphorylase [Kangsaoukella pontilimi]MXQ09405.1 glycogen/starch/alpha-glucan family phosphorylase [Kangsaoukella pontilimi]